MPQLLGTSRRAIWASGITAAQLVKLFTDKRHTKQMSDEQRDSREPTNAITEWGRGGGRRRVRDTKSAAADIPHRFSGKSAVNDLPLESPTAPQRDSDLQAKLECYQMLVSEHQWCLHHMPNRQFEPLHCCLFSKSLPCNAHCGPGAHKNPSYPP